MQRAARCAAGGGGRRQADRPPQACPPLQDASTRAHVRVQCVRRGGAGGGIKAEGVCRWVLPGVCTCALFEGGASSACGGGGEGWHKASVSDCLPLAAPIGLSPLLILTLCGSERVLVVSTEPPDDLSCLTTGGGGAVHPFWGGVGGVKGAGLKKNREKVGSPWDYLTARGGGGGGLFLLRESGTVALPLTNATSAGGGGGWWR